MGILKLLEAAFERFFTQINLKNRVEIISLIFCTQMKMCHFLGIISRKTVPKCRWERQHLKKRSILAPGTNFHVNRSITYLGIPSNRFFVSFRSNKSGLLLNFVTIISLSHWFTGRYYFFSIGHLAKSSIHTLYKRNK